MRDEPVRVEWREVGRGDTMTAARENARTALGIEGQEVPDEEFRFSADDADDADGADGVGGFRAFVRVAPEETTVERLTLVSELGWLHFHPPVTLQPGEVFWKWGRTLRIRSLDGAVRQVQARPRSPSDRRSGGGPGPPHG